MFGLWKNKASSLFMIPGKTPKAKPCAHCKEKFTPQKMGQKVCSPKCALAIAPSNRDKAEKALERQRKAEHREAKEKVKPKGQYAKEAQQAVNEWIRLRDSELPCVSCGRHHQGQYHAGHYRSVAGNPALRYEPLNIHKQCAPCNTHKSGDLINFRVELLKRIGSLWVDWLEGPHEPKRYTIPDLKAITADYRAKVRELKAAKG